jgi:hypothetical protein
MRNVISILLLVLALFQAAGHLIIFKIQQYEICKEIKRQIKAGVPEEVLVLLKIPRTLEAAPNSIFQRIHEREFRYDDKLYDIVRQETHGDTTWYYCLSDEKETQLFANLDELMKRDMNRNAERRQQIGRLLHLLGSLFFNPHDDAPFIYALEDVESIIYLFNLKTWIDTPPTPPPEV